MRNTSTIIRIGYLKGGTFPNGATCPLSRIVVWHDCSGLLQITFIIMEMLAKIENVRYVVVPMAVEPQTNPGVQFAAAIENGTVDLVGYLSTMDYARYEEMKFSAPIHVSRRTFIMKAKSGQMSVMHTMRWVSLAATGYIAGSLRTRVKTSTPEITVRYVMINFLWLQFASTKMANVLLKTAKIKYALFKSRPVKDMTDLAEKLYAGDLKLLQGAPTSTVLLQFNSMLSQRYPNFKLDAEVVHEMRDQVRRLDDDRFVLQVRNFAEHEVIRATRTPLFTMDDTQWSLAAFPLARWLQRWGSFKYVISRSAETGIIQKAMKYETGENKNLQKHLVQSLSGKDGKKDRKVNALIILAIFLMASLPLSLERYLNMLFHR